MNSCCKAVLILCGVIVVAIFACGVLAGVGYGIAEAVMRANAQNEFSAGFQHCCPSVANDLNLTQEWTDNCLDLVDSFKTAYDTSNYTPVLLDLGMRGRSYSNPLFWSSNRVMNIATIVMSIALKSPPSSFNIPAGAFGNCISNQYTSMEFQNRFVQYWFMYSQMMAERAISYVYWLTSGDITTRYFPDVEMGMMERIWGMRELPNLQSSVVPGVVVLNARSANSTGLTCAGDTQSRDKLVSINNKLIYVCCDVALTDTAILSIISDIRQALPHPAAVSGCIEIYHPTT